MIMFSASMFWPGTSIWNFFSPIPGTLTGADMHTSDTRALDILMRETVSSPLASLSESTKSENPSASRPPMSMLKIVLDSAKLAEIPPSAMATPIPPDASRPTPRIPANRSFLVCPMSQNTRRVKLSFVQTP